MEPSRPSSPLRLRKSGPTSSFAIKSPNLLRVPEHKNTDFMHGLELLEKKRADLKEATSLSGFKLLFRWNGTVMRMVLRDVRIYISFGLFFFAHFYIAIARSDCWNDVIFARVLRL